VGANGLIGTTGTPSGDSFLGNILGIFLVKVFKFKKKSLKFSLYYFVKGCVKKIPKICHLKIFEVHL